MKDMRKTKAQLVEELTRLRQQNAELEIANKKTAKTDRALLGNLVDQMMEATVILDWEGNILRGNALAAKVIGVDSPADLVGVNIAGIVHPDSLAAAAGDLEQVKQSSAPFSAQYKLLIGGRTVHIDSHGTKIDLEDGSVDLVSFRDVSGIRNTEIELKRQEMRFQSMVENANDIIYTIRPEDGTLLYVSPNWKQMLGHEPEEVIGTTFMPYIHPDDLPVCLDFLEQVMQTGEKHEGMEYRIQHQDGSWKWHMSNASTMITPEGETLFSGIARDIGERKYFEQELIDAQKKLEERVRERTIALEQSEKMFRALTESMNAMVVIVSIEQERVIYANPAATKLTGYSFEELTANPPPALLSTASQQEAERLREEYYQDQVLPDRFETEIVTKTGKKRWLESAVALIEIGDSGIQKVVTSFDITERKLAEQALRESEKKFRALADSTTASIAIVGDEGNRFYFANQTLLDRVGMSWDEFSALNPHASLTPVAREAGTRAIEEAQKRGLSQYRFEYKEENQEWREVNVVLTEIDGEPAEIFTSFDITEHKLAQERLAIFQKFAETSGQGFGMADLNGHITYVNPAVTRFTGLGSPEEGIGKHFSDFHPPEYRTQFEEEVVPAVLERGEWTGEIPMLHKNGTLTPMILSMFQLRDETGDPQRFAAVLTDISERKSAEEALRENEKKFRALAESTAAQITVIQDDHYTYANQAFLDYFGLDMEDLQVARPEDIGTGMMSPETMERAAIEFNDAVERGEKFFRIEYPDNSGNWFQSNVSMIELDGKPSFIGMTFDITELKRAQEKLQAEQERLMTLFDGISEVIYVSDPQTYEILYANKYLRDAIGKPLVGEICYKEFQNLNEPCPFCTNARILKNQGEAYQWEHHNDVIDHDYLVTDRIIKWPDGRDVRFELAIDITDRKRAQRELAANEERYRTIFDTAGTGMISFGEDMVITMANEEWIELSGYTKEETIGKLTWVPFFTEDSLAKMKKYHESRSQDPDSVPRAYEAQFVDRAGRIHDGIVNIQIIPGTKQRVASFQDMTQLKRAQHEMYRADKMAALGQIIAGVAHEINNPNNFIFFNLPILRKYIEAIRPLLEHHLEANPDLKILNMPYNLFLEDVFKLLENMEHGSKRITGIVSELKTYVRSDDEANIMTGEVGPVIDRVMALVGKQVRKMVKNFDLQVAKDLPLIDMNPGRIEQVLINLVINAGQAADKEDSWVKLVARTVGTQADWLEIRVSDNGLGIPEEIREQIFEPFFTSKGRELGTGLGLSISQRIIEEHGGTIDVSSTPGEGTTFTVRLPGSRG